MAALITRLQKLIGDPNSAVWDIDTLQDYLDENQTIARYLRLRDAPFRTPGGVIIWLDYFSDELDNWEDDVQLYDRVWQPISASLIDRADLVTGHWTFTTSMTPPIYLIGKSYDLYNAAADVLEAWAAKLALEFDFTSQRQQFHRSQQATALQKRADTYRLRGRPRKTTMVRSDVSSMN